MYGVLDVGCIHFIQTPLTVSFLFFSFFCTLWGISIGFDALVSLHTEALTCKLHTLVQESVICTHAG